jgi:hypothetical protein
VITRKNAFNEAGGQQPTGGGRGAPLHGGRAWPCSDCTGAAFGSLGLVAWCRAKIFGLGGTMRLVTAFANTTEYRNRGRGFRVARTLTP